ncbi:uncharacterized protein LOC110109345 [Dendrobium catenatum]|uniref:uncharacterized protein LOC110109345 n=1 Tax=Dendrobium catenatum TaxID=906689 RepID=UPI0009F59D52|nr:uncharacterized protein LOC110109345 [Dendrobium catenatum]
MGILGSKSTWCHNKSGSARILERLDRCMLNLKALELISQAAVSLGGKHSWAKSVRGDDMEALNKRLSRVLKALFFFSKVKHQKLEELKEKSKDEIKKLWLEEALDQQFLNSNALLFRSKVDEFNCTLSRLNTWWRQRDKAKWMKEVDSNSSFFHAFVNGNLIKELKNDDGELIKDPEIIRRNFSEFFYSKWKLRDCQLENWPLNENLLKHERAEILDAIFSIEEVEEVIRELSNNISPEVDGITYSSIKAY